MQMKYPLSLGNVEDLLKPAGIDLSYEAVRLTSPGSTRLICWEVLLQPLEPFKSRTELIHRTFRRQALKLADAV